MPIPLSVFHRLRLAFRVLGWFVISMVLGFTVAAAIVGMPFIWKIKSETILSADLHVRYHTAHPGWSFPARVWSAPALLDIPLPRRILHARARNYHAACPPRKPGDFCAKTGDVIPRGGWFPEGEQPPGRDDWTRPLAFEPVLLSWLVGKDGEIREHLPLDRAPAHLLAAIIASEDENFLDHQGVDVIGMGRAVWANLRGGGYAQGGSTLTMQVIRNLSQQREKTVSRKLREIVEAVVLDDHLGKEGVLQLYLDSPYLGQDGNFSICGFAAAAQYYWGVAPEDITLAQAATLAAILPAPGRFGPDRNPKVAKERRDRLLRHMGTLGWDIQAALEEPVDTHLHHLPMERYPTYLQAARAELEFKLPMETVYGAGLNVVTGLDVAVQQETERLMGEKVPYLERTVGRRGDGPLLAAGAIVTPKNGVLVAAYDPTVITSNDFNRATQARRQAGSSFKPLVYALAFSPGVNGQPKYSADRVVPNSPREFAGTNGWKPRNTGGHYTPTTCLANGLAWSHNIATASLLAELGGPRPLIEFARKIGYDTSKFPEEMGLALGQGEVTPQEMARFAATIASGGKFQPATPVLAAYDPSGAPRFETPGPGRQALTPEAALLTRELMRLVVTFGTGGASRGGAGFPGYDGPAIGKTGTTDGEKDLWFVGSTAEYSAALWLGYDTPTPIGAPASDLAAPLWGWWMRAVHAGLPQHDFDGPKYQRVGVCTQTGKLPIEGCHIIPAPFLPGTKPKGSCPGGHAPAPEAIEEEHSSIWEKIAADAETSGGQVAFPENVTPPSEPAPAVPAP